MKNSKTIIKTVTVLILVSIALIAYLRIGATYNTMQVGFYGLEENVVAELTNWLNNRNIDWRPVVFDDSIPLDEQIKVPIQQNLLFTSDSKNMDEIAPFVRTAKTNNLLLMPIPLRISVKTDSRLTATPILLDHFQLSYNVEALREIGATLPTNFTELEAIAQEILNNQQGISSVAPILCTGGNDDDLVQFFSAMLETKHGIENYEIATAFLSVLADDADNADVLGTESLASFFELPQVNDTLQHIISWQNKRFLSSAWLNLSRDDIARAMENESAIFTFGLFSEYEELSTSTKNTYAPWYMPSGGTRETRHLVAPSVVVMEFSYVKSPMQSARQSGKKNDLAASLIAELVSGFVQSELSEATNLVPVNASAMVNEMGAGETRQIFSLSDGIISDIASASFSEKNHKEQFAQALRSEIRRIEQEM